MKKGFLSIVGIVLFLTPNVNAQEVVLKGSDTMILLGQKCAQMFRLKNQQSRFSVQGGGPKLGLEAVRAGKADILQSEDQLTDAQNLLRLPVGVETIVLYVNRTNPVKELSVAQVRSIFLGEIRNWKEIGGPNEPILLFAGESNTGILDYFQNTVLKGKEPYPFVGKSSTKDLLDTIGANQYGIGYAALGSSLAVKAIRIRGGSATNGIEPTSDNIRGRLYPLSRYVYWYVRSKQDPQLIDFMQWLYSAQWQVTVESVGFQPLLPGDRANSLSKLSKMASTNATGK